MNVYIDRDKLYNKLSSLFNGWLEWFKDENMSVRYARDKILPMIMEEIPIDLYTKVLDSQYEIVDKIQACIPAPLWDNKREWLLDETNYTKLNCCLECVREMKDSWEAENGSNLVWVPGHYEEVKDENH